VIVERHSIKEEIELWRSFVDSLSSKEDRELFENMLNKYATSINAKGEPFLAEPLIMASLLSQHKMIDWLTKQISKQESVDNNKEVKQSKQQQEEELGMISLNVAWRRGGEKKVKEGKYRYFNSTQR
jgi:hypothetical protein